MTQRLNALEVAKGPMKAMYGLETYLAKCGLEASLPFPEITRLGLPMRLIPFDSTASILVERSELVEEERPL